MIIDYQKGATHLLVLKYQPSKKLFRLFAYIIESIINILCNRFTTKYMPHAYYEFYHYIIHDTAGENIEN
jgi:hypothetical protein